MARRNIVTLVIIGIGFLLFAINSVRELPLFIASSTTHVEYPEKFDYPAYSALLRKYVTPTLVDYESLSKSKELPEAMRELATVSPKKFATNQERLAYWINAYNLLVLKNICEHYPIDYARDVGGNFSSQQFVVAGTPLSAEGVFSLYLVPLATKVEPLSLFLTCKGAVGFPPLMDHAITAEHLKEESRAAAEAYANSPKNVVYDAKRNRLYVSAFYDWNRSTLESKYGNVYSMINELLAKKIDIGDANMIKSPTLKFDWRVNDTKLARRQ